MVVGSAAATLRVLVFPVTGRPRPADAIVVLAGTDEAARLHKGLELYDAGVAPLVVVSFPFAPDCPIRLADAPVRCMRPVPSTTRGEARALSRLAAAERWHRLLVVTSRFQATRAKIRIERCFSGHVTMATVSPSIAQWPAQIAYEWGAMGKAVLLQRGC